MNDIRCARLRLTVRLLTYARLLLLAMAVVLVPRGRFTPAMLVPLGVVAAVSVAVSQVPRLVPLLARGPLVLTADAVAAYLVLETGGGFGPYFPFTVVTSALAGVLYDWRGLVFVCALQMALYDLAVRSVAGGQVAAAATLPLFYPVAGCVGVAVRRLLDRFADAEEARRRAEIVAASADERMRLARDMHDSLAKTLHGIALSAAALPAWVRRSPDRAEKEAERLAAAVRVAVAEARELIAGLRDDGRRPLPAAVRRIAEEWGEHHGIAVRTSVDERADLPPALRGDALAILGEALNNVARHAHARRVEVTLSGGDGRAELAVRDDGGGFACPPALPDLTAELARGGHYGIVGMAERARRAGGTLTVTSSPGAGCLLTAVLPGAGADP